MIKLPKYLPSDYVESIIRQQSYPKYRMMLRVMWATAMRVGELATLKLSDIDRNEWLIRLTGKGQKQRLIPLTDELKMQLLAYIRWATPKEYLFENCDGKHYSTHGVYNIVRDAGLLKQLYVTPHMLRHSKATDMVNKHVGLWHVQQVLGHKDIRTTTVYLHTAVNDLRKVMQTYNQQ